MSAYTVEVPSARRSAASGTRRSLIPIRPRAAEQGTQLVGRDADGCAPADLEGVKVPEPAPATDRGRADAGDRRSLLHGEHVAPLAHADVLPVEVAPVAELHDHDRAAPMARPRRIAHHEHRGATVGAGDRREPAPVALAEAAADLGLDGEERG